MVYCQGGTTEAGIRQKIQYDARPVMFDEAESENQQAMNRIQHVIELARQSSFDGGAEIMKGTANGSGMSFRMRSMFMMGSINVGLKQAADESRFTVVSLTKAERTAESVDRFRAFEAKVLETLTDDFCRSIRARAYHMIPVIRANAKTFSTAVAKLMGSQRIGDQIGTLLAGYWALLDDGLFELDEAKAIVARLNLDEAQEAEQVSDEDNCLSRIMQRQVRVDGMNGAINRSLGELIQIAVTRNDSVAITATMARDVLPRFGISVEKDGVYFSNTHNEIETCLMNTAWQSGWSRILLRIDGAKKGVKTHRFAGSSTRFVSLPFETFE
jgi:putative DNA primase/helicase